ncbi:hypothetical protein B9Z19DRAFT_832382 [Tuber borchii]|uniref:Extracellular membrane protein CFEM domain-containing protein n=1 Tax=Tuber borchii TaxID=42251 RepID=A0A2T6ZV96_TUBBO|nr:hypothetical protein B9Z19DRAFT_832382 [Tuber borchii]
MILHKCCFGPLWITTLMLSCYFLVVGGQTLGSLAKSGCFHRCFIMTCPGLGANCVCSGFRTALSITEIWACAQICPIADVIAGFLALGVECPPFISTATGRGRTRRTCSSSAPIPPLSSTLRSTSRPAALPTPNPPTASTTSSIRASISTQRTQPTGTPGLPSGSTSSSFRSSDLTSLSSTFSKCTTPTSIMNSSSFSSASSTPSTPSTPSPSTSATTKPSLTHHTPVDTVAIIAAVFGSLGFLMALLAIFLVLRQRQAQNRRSITSLIDIVDFGADRGSITAPLPIFNPPPPRVPLADIDTRPATQGSQMSAGTGAGAVTAVVGTREAPTRREPIAVAMPVPGPSRSSSRLYIFPPPSRRLPGTQRQPQPQQGPDLRSLKKPLPQLPQLPEEARIRPSAGPSTRSIPLALPPTAYPIEDTPRPMSAISESAEVDRYRPILDDATEVEFRRVYQDVRRALNRSPSTSTDQNSTDWSIMTDLSRNSTIRSSGLER